MESPGPSGTFAVPSPKPTLTLDEIRQRIEPTSLAGQRQLPVPDDLAGLFPSGGIPAGWTVGIRGRAAWATAAMLAASLMEQHRWAALIGSEEFGLVAAAELGLALDRVLLIDHPPADRWGEVIAVVLEAVSVIVVKPTRPLGRRDTRRIGARLREQGAVLLHLGHDRTWPEPLNVTLRATSSAWTGLGWGHGHLQSRTLTVEAEGRRSMARQRQAVLAGLTGSP